MAWVNADWVELSCADLLSSMKNSSCSRLMTVHPKQRWSFVVQLDTMDGAAESQTESLTWECCRQQLIAAVAWWVSVSSVQRVPSRAVYFFYIGINYPRLLLCENGPSSCDGTILPSTIIIMIITRHLLHPLTSIRPDEWGVFFLLWSQCGHGSCEWNEQHHFVDESLIM